MSFIVGGLTAAGVFGPASLVTVAAGASIGSMVGSTLSGIFGRQTKAEEREQIAAAEELYQERVDRLEERKGLDLSAAKSQYASGMEELGLGTRMKATDIQTSGYGTMSQQNLVTSPVAAQMERKMKDLMAEHRITAKRQLDTRNLLTAQTHLRFREGEASALDAFESAKTDIESQTPWYRG